MKKCVICGKEYNWQEWGKHIYKKNNICYACHSNVKNKDKICKCGKVITNYKDHPDKQIMKNILFPLLYSKAFRYREDPPFTLAYGKTSPYYFNCKAVTLDPEGCFLTGKLMFNEIKEFNIDAIGGLTLGADPISLSTSLEAYQNDIRITPLIVRKEGKGHGNKSWVEGNLEAAHRVVVVDDVITTGRSTIFAIDRLWNAGLEVTCVVALIDREEGGRENIEARGVGVIPLFNKTDFDTKRRQEND